MTFPAFESLIPTAEQARQLLQFAGTIRDRTKQLGVDIDSGQATPVTVIRWLDDIAAIVPAMVAILSVSGMQPTLRALTGNGTLAMTDEATVLRAALADARAAAKGMVPFLAPHFDDASFRLKNDVPLASVVPTDTLGAFRASLAALVATIAAGAP